MNVIAVNGSPRRDWNTGMMLESALQGAESEGAETRLVHLRDVDFKGCMSCFACKRKGSTCNGLCALRDELRPLLEAVLQCDVLFIGSPVYFGDVTGMTRSFMERLLFPNISYNAFGTSTFPRQTSCGLILTMSCSEEHMTAARYDALIETNVGNLGILKGRTEVVLANETWQFPDYAEYEAAVFDVAERAKRRAEVFPVERRKAFELGARLARA